MVSTAVYVNNLYLNLCLSNKSLCQKVTVKCFTSCVQMDIFPREDISHTAGVYNNKCKSFELGIGGIIVVCLYCYENFLDYGAPCGIGKNIQPQTLMILFSSLLPSSSSSSSLSTKEIESRSESLGLFDTLKCNPQAFYSHMTKYVMPTVEGTDLGRLLYYYTLLDAAGCEPHVTTTIKPNSHVKLLKKLRAVANGKAFFLCHCNADGTATQ